MDRFPTRSFDGLNEADIREEVVAPLLKCLGYQSGTHADIVRELSLRYPKQFLGRKKTSKDPQLRGRADYVMEIGKRLRWTIEAKPPSLAVARNDIEQAYTYAVHPEVKAVYFALCNGRELRVYSTIASPEAPELLSVAYEQFEERFLEIAGLLSPESIKREFGGQVYPVGVPIGPGFRSVARISTGRISYNANSLGDSLLSQIVVSITRGTIERNESGGLTAYLETQSPLRIYDELNKRLGLDKFEMVSNGGELSTDTGRPTEFVYSTSTIFPEGEMLPIPASGNEIRLTANLRCHAQAIGKGVLRGRVFAGSFEMLMQFDGLPVGNVNLAGDFSIQL